MAGTKTKLISLTEKATGYAFKLAADKIINFYGVNSGADSYITYLSQMNGELVSTTVDEAVATINTAAAKTFAITLYDSGTTLYIHADRVVYFSELSLYTLIGYYNEQQKLEIITSSDLATTIDTACGNTFAVTMSEDGSTRYLNCNLLANITSKTAFRQAILSVLLRAEGATVVAPGSGYDIGDLITIDGGTKTTAAIFAVATSKLVSAAIDNAGSGYAAADTITLAGGTAATPAVITVDTVDGLGAILTFTITTAGNYTVQATAFTQASTSGSGTGATFDSGLFGVRTVTVNTAGNYSVTPSNPASQDTSDGVGTGVTFTVLYEILAVTVVDGGNNYSNPPTITISGDGTLGAATATIVNGSVNQVTVTVPGGGYTAATAVASGGAGSLIIYDAKGTSFDQYNVEETPATIQTAVNAL